jgi:hypothetical protein
MDLQRYGQQPVAGIAPKQRSEIAPDSPIVKTLYTRCDEIIALAKDQELGAIPGNIERLKARIVAAKRQGTLLLTEQILDDVTRLKNDFISVLENRWFYDVDRVSTVTTAILSYFAA